ncbi:MAG: class I SAM-dependent methyltransferase [Acidobacteriota bacterium]
MSRQKTATRTTLDASWQERQKKVDWMHAPKMAEYVNGMVSQKDLHANGHWGIHARDQHLKPLADAKGRGLRMMTLASGSGHVEEFLIGSLHWPVEHMLGLEYDVELRRHAAKRFANIEGCTSEFRFFDFNDLRKLDVGQFDVIFTCHSIHHCEDLEGMLEFINRSLTDDGILLGIDYFGPSRFQIEPDALEIIEHLFSCLPPHLRQNLESGHIEETFQRARIADVRRADPSESPRSSDLRTLLFSNFPAREVRPMGGTLLRWLLQYRAGNFDPENPSDVAILDLLQFIEKTFIERRWLRSDDLFFALGKSARV